MLLSYIALRARAGLDAHARVTPKWSRFPTGYCALSSELLGRWLLEAGWKDVVLVQGGREGFHHVWIEVGGVIVDITCDQFGQPPVVVASQSVWHSGWEIELKAAVWFLYPHPAWFALKSSIERGARWLKPANARSSLI